MPKFMVNSLYPRTVRITPDSPRSEIVTVFTRGNCHSFALALHKLKGWPMFGLFKDDSYPDLPHHVVVRTPRGALLDVQGRGVEKRWQGFELRPVRKGHLRRMVQKWNDGGVGFIPSNVRGALPFAERLLARMYGN